MILTRWKIEISFVTEIIWLNLLLNYTHYRNLFNLFKLADEELHIVDENESGTSIKGATGEQLSSFITGHSAQVKSKLQTPREAREKRILLHISGTMSSKLCQGQFSKYENTMTVKVLGLNLSFSREYLETIRAMTGYDLRHSAYQIQTLTSEMGNAENLERCIVLCRIWLI